MTMLLEVGKRKNKTVKVTICCLILDSSCVFVCNAWKCGVFIFVENVWNLKEEHDFHGFK